MTARCARCGASPAVVPAYWGPWLCRPCAQHVAELLDLHDKWPPVPWDDEQVTRELSEHEL